MNLKEVCRSSILTAYETKALRALSKVATESNDGVYEVTLVEKRTECGRLYSSNYTTAAAITMRAKVRGAVLGK